MREILRRPGEPASPSTSIGFADRAGPRARDLGKIVDGAGATLAASAASTRLAEVRSAVAARRAQRDRLAQALSRATGRTIEVKVVVDPTVVGGVVARVGDEVFDGSIASRLEDAKQRTRERVTRWH